MDSTRLITRLADLVVDVDPTSWADGKALVYNAASSKWKATALTPALVGLGNVSNAAQLVAANNLSDLPSKSAARTSLQLGSAATLNADNSANNLAILNSSGLLASSVIPPLAIAQVNVVASQVAMLALSAQRGDTAVRTDTSKTYILSTDDPTTLVNWIEMLGAGESPVQSVAGRTGTIILAAADIASGVLATTRLGTGAGSASNYLRGDGSWHTLVAADIPSLSAIYLPLVGGILTGTTFITSGHKLGVGISSFTNYPFEGSVFQSTGDMKLGIYGDSTASITFGCPTEMDQNGLPTGFDFQYVPDVDPTLCRMRFNWIERNTNGTVANANSDLFTVFGNGLTLIQPVQSGGLTIQTNDPSLFPVVSIINNDGDTGGSYSIIATGDANSEGGGWLLFHDSINEVTPLRLNSQAVVIDNGFYLQADWMIPATTTIQIGDVQNSQDGTLLTVDLTGGGITLHGGVNGNGSAWNLGGANIGGVASMNFTTISGTTVVTGTTTMNKGTSTPSTSSTHGYLWVDSSGHLQYKNPTGTVTQLAA